MLKHLFIPLALALGYVGLVGCQTDDATTPHAAEIAQLPGLRVTIAGADLAHDKVQAIAKFVEGKSVDTGAAMVRMKKDDKGGGTLEIELFAKTLPQPGALIGDLKASFPELAGASINVNAASAEEATAQMPIVEVSKELSPAEAQAEIVEQLKAQGVDGDIKVEVQDGAEGRRVEVKVEKSVDAPGDSLPVKP